jgi:hypothetical protein
LTIDESTDWDTEKTPAVDAHPLVKEFTEGTGASLDPRSPLGSGPGVTWNCATDDNIANLKPECTERWDGGIFRGVRGFPVMHVTGQTGEVSWDVTNDVLAGVSSWLLKKTDEATPGRVLYYSKEGAVVVGNPNVAPRLILEQ